MFMPTLSSVVLACATFVAAAGTCANTQELTLLQTILQVDEGQEPLVLQTASEKPVSRLQPPTYVSMIFLVVAVVYAVTKIYGFHRAIMLEGAHEKRGKEAEKAGAEVSISNAGPSEAGVENGAAAPDKAPAKKAGMTWATFLLGLGWSVMTCFCTDQYVPHMPMIQKDFGCSQEEMAFTLQVNLIIKGVACVCAGVVSDRVGRKPVLVFGCFLLSMSCLACGSTTQIGYFYWARALQGLGEGIEAVVRSTYRDSYDDMKDRVRVGSCSMLIGLLAPAVAPSVGQEVTQRAGSWRVCFWLFGAITILLYFGMLALFKETLDLRNRPQTSMSQDFKAILGDRHVMCILLIGVIQGAGGVLTMSNLVYVMEEDFGMSAINYSRLSFAGCLMAVLGIFLNRCISHIHPLTVMRASFHFLTLFAVLLFVLTKTKVLDNTWWFLSLAWLYTIFTIPLGMNMGPVYMERMKHTSGLAGGIQAAVGGVFGTLIAKALERVVVVHGAHGLMYTMVGILITSAAVFWAGLGLYPPKWITKDLHK